VRLLNVLDAVEPQVKADAPGTTFPGALGDLAVAGTGRTLRLGGVAVLPTADLHGTYDVASLDVYPDGDSFVDMAGPGADLAYWSSTQNVVLSFSCDPAAPPAEADASLRRATLRVARDLAAAAAGTPPDDVERLDLPATPGELPRVCVILQVASEGPLVDTFLYGRPVRDLVPTVLDPREVLDGALTAGQYDWAGVRDPTYFWQRSSLIRELLRRHGADLCFCGVILTLAYQPAAFDKERTALLAAKLARQLGAEAAVLTTFQTGNSHTDTVLTCRACERLGIRTVLLLAETNGGLTDHVPEADCIVSVGNEEELVPPWRPERVIGGDRTWTGRPADDAGPVPAVTYFGSLCQMGDMRLRAVSW
jgi:glycine reductase complex component B subunit alpha and beta